MGIKEEKTASSVQPFWKKLGPGLISGAADDDPSGIATYSQVGAGFGYAMLWTTFITFPFMVGIQIVSARIGRVTGKGLAANIRQHYIGMGFSNLIAFFIMLTATVTLHQHGIVDIQTSAQAAEALRPIAGEYAFLLFSAGT